MGWFIGILLVLGFIALGEAMSRTGDDSGGSVAIGLGMGTGVGFMQWLAIRHHLAVGQRWFWFYVIGFSLGYILLDLVPTHAIPSLTTETAMPFATLVGALITGWLQYRFVLRNIMARAISWIAYMSLGWFSAYVITASIVVFNNMKLGEHFPKIFLLVFALALLTLGGPLLGYITGRFIVPRIQRLKATP
jgi:hypothetical protein